MQQVRDDSIVLSSNRSFTDTNIQDSEILNSRMGEYIPETASRRVRQPQIDHKQRYFDRKRTMKNPKTQQTSLFASKKP